MEKIIPRNLIKHLEWTPGQALPQPAPVSASSPAIKRFSIDDILKGQPFYSNQKDGDNWVGLPIALREALKYAGSDGIIATMPELIAAKLKTDKNHDFWKQWYTVHTEENIGIDTKGRFYTPNEPVLVVVNGGGILTPDRIELAYAEGLINNSAKYRQEEFDKILDGALPNGDTLALYRLEEIKAGVSNLPHRFGVVMPYAVAQGTPSGYHSKEVFMENPLVIARAGGVEHLDAFFEKAKDTNDDTLGNHHPFAGRDASQPQGRVLFLGNNCYGLDGNFNLNNDGRFVGVAPEAHGAKK